ncbi:MAG: hypothetical protein J0L92_40560, partial [Deltaproteobacteria bacterium]|nr:hypothetical protein [Deltaproteobacteria bacterium]
MSAPDDDAANLEAANLEAADLEAGSLDALDAAQAPEHQPAYEAGALSLDDAGEDPADAGLDLDALARAQGEGPLLSAEESAALFDAIRTGAVEAHATRPATLGSAD